jgi:hypothetical protein
MSSAQFYVMNMKDELVPAKFLMGLDGNYVINPNSPINNVNTRNNHYYNLDGTEISSQVANPNNYLVVPVNYSIDAALQFANDVNSAASHDVSPTGMMIGGFVGEAYHPSVMYPIGAGGGCTLK